MSISVIRQFFEGRLHTWATAQSLPVAYENVDFEKPVNSTWLQATLMPTTTFNTETTAAHSRHLGLFQVTVWSRKGNGSGECEQVAEAVAALFPVLPKGTVSVEKPPHIGQAMSDDSGWIGKPVLITYRYEA